ncbi:MAG: RNA-binding protein [bacterium]|nr:RNA-binding protein [bacterium]
MGTKLYVGNLSFELSEDELKDAFGGDGREVREVAIIMDRATGRSRGFGFVTMGSDRDAQAAITALDGQELGGRRLRVSEAMERPDRGGGGGGRGPGGGGFGRGGGGGGGRGGFGGGRGGGGGRPRF